MDDREEPPAGAEPAAEPAATASGGATGGTASAAASGRTGALDAGRNRIADRLEQIGDRLDSRAQAMDQAGGVQRRAGQVAQRTSAILDSGADYIRAREPAEMRDDLEEAIRARPLLSVGMALGAGFLLAKLFRE
ncbi:MAG: hypothetical protein WEF86_13645 [Gemmatimonadota bacterium]